MTFSRFSSLAASLLLAGCATVGGTLWSDVPVTATQHRYAPCSIVLPPGWAYLQTRTDSGDVLVATDTGTSLQSIRVVHRANRKAFPSIEKGATPAMSVEELAQRFIEDTTSRFAMDVVEVLNNQPVTLDGHEGFRVHWRYQIENLRYQAVALGAIRADGFYLVIYNAPTLHYFDRYREDFEAAVRTFRFL